MAKLIGHMQVNDVLLADVIEPSRHPGQRKLRLRPINPSVYFQGRTDIELTPRELQDIVDLVKANS